MVLIDVSNVARTLDGMKLTYRKHTFNFNIPGGTSRGILHTKNSWILSLKDDESDFIAIAECSIIEGLSPEFKEEGKYVQELDKLINQLKDTSFSFFFDKDSSGPQFSKNGLEFLQEWVRFPSIKFGLECALLSMFHKSNALIFDNEFSQGKSTIQVNGLVWMGDISFMQKQIEEKLEQGYSTIKLKVGAIELSSELKIIEGLRKQLSSDKLAIRVDANGAFSRENVRGSLHELAQLEVHSIEQPIAVGQIDLLRELCHENILPIALDEELISCYSYAEKQTLLQTVKPQFIVLKPSLHGGIVGTQEWIQLADNNEIDWWLTSALEGNIGLLAIAQLAAEYDLKLPQGLGTGSLYSNNFPSLLVLENGYVKQVL